MRPSASDIVDIWEWGWHRHLVDRGLGLLMRSVSDVDWDGLTSLPVGRRNQYLLDLHEQLCGNRLECRIVCPRCASELEFDVPTDVLRGGERLADTSNAEPHILECGDFSLRFRLLDSRDLAAVAHFETVAAARATLVQRSLLGTYRAGAECAIDEVPESAVAALADELERLDPAVVMRLPLTCDACAHEWLINLDLVQYVWTELSSAAERVLTDVHDLASAYGWREAEVLNLSEVRRRTYLGLVRR